jgi:DNA (cytosine-5)-methyltransferase 1
VVRRAEPGGAEGWAAEEGGVMRFGSVCSGIEAASVAWQPFGWRCAFASEIEAFPRAVLAHRHPATPLHGDFTTIQAGDYEPIDLLVGGTPCQSFSVAGLRRGLADERGNLALEYLRLADRLRPRWLVWENVPGVLSSSGGRDFGAFLGGLGELGYGFAYRVLDAQYCGVAQRRRRVFVVGYLGDWRRAAAVLFEPASLRRHPAPRREAREDVARCLTRGSDSGQRYDGETDTLLPVAHTLRARGFDASEDGTGRGTPLVPVAFDRHMAMGAAVRRLTPRECERLQGLPDDYTLVPWRGGVAPDGPRYRALGNSMAVPVMRWIGARIAMQR